MKVFQPGAGTDGNVWDRDVRAYRSGLLSYLPEGFAAPRLFDIHEDSNGGLWLWLESIADMYGGNWPRNYYGLAARHFGHFNGTYLARRQVPDYWLLKRDWAKPHSGAAPHIDDLLMRARGRREFNATFLARVRALIDDQPLLLRALSELPQTLCHHDAATANLFARVARNGITETVAVDWEEIGPGAVGAELATFVFGTMRRCEFPSTDARALDRLAFDGYVRGLQTAGWDGDPRLARLGYTAAVGLRWFLLTGILQISTDERVRDKVEKEWSKLAETLLSQWIPLAHFLLDCGDEARSLAAMCGKAG